MRSGLVLLGGGAALRRPLISPGTLRAPLTLMRSQPSGAVSTALGADDTTWGPFGADAPRFYGRRRRLVIGGQRVNLNANPRTPAGTGWTNTGIASVTAVTGPDGDAASANRLTESTASSGHFSAFPAISFTTGLSYAISAFVAPGTCTTCQIAFAMGAFGANAWANFDLSGAGAVGSVGAAITRTRIQKFGAWFLVEAVAPATATLSTSSAISLTQTATDGRLPTCLGTSRTLDLSWAQTEQASFASTPILPPVGTPGASTRGADQVTGLLSALGVGGGGACTILWKGMLPQNAPSGVTQALFRLDDGSTNNLFGIGNSSATSLVLERRTANSPATQTIGSMVAGTPFRLGLSVAAGRAAASLDGAPVVTVSGGPTSGLTTVRVGNSPSLAAPMFGEIEMLMIQPITLSDADLAARVAAV